MSIWKGIKSAFGFGGETDDEEEEYDSSLPTYAAAPRVKTAPDTDNVKTDSVVAPDVNVEAKQQEQVAYDILGEIVRLLNERQPLLVEYIRTRIGNAGTRDTASPSETSCCNDSELRQQIAALEDKLKETESLKQENRKLRLSVERQKRALLDRINDLESQVAAHNAEREKFYASKHSGHHSQQQEASAHEKEAADARIKELEDTLAKREEELDRQTTLRRQLEDKTQMSDVMINELRNQAAAERNEYESTCRLQQEAIEHINEQVQEFEEIKEKMRSRIAQLKQELKEEKEKNALLSSQAAAAPAAPDLSERSDSADASAVPEIADADSAPVARRRRGRPKKARLDDDLDNTDWFSPGGDSNDFGYHEPPRRPSNDNAAQLSLF